MRAWSLLLTLVIALVIACSRSNEPLGRSAQAQTKGVASPTERKAEVTPALARKAEEILRANEGAAIGTEIPFSLDGRRYLARFEEHDNPEGDPDRPAGRHKGVTVYVRD
jgi:hypothetical protein